MIIYHYIVSWKGGRVVNCTNFENWRGLTVTGGSNPSLSEKKSKIKKKMILDYQNKNFDKT